MSSMINPFYIDHRYSLGQIATVVKVFGLSVSLVGVVVAGSLIAKLGIRTGLVLGSLMIMLSNLGFALLATTAGPTVIGLALANSLGQSRPGNARHGVDCVLVQSHEREVHGHPVRAVLLVLCADRKNTRRHFGLCGARDRLPAFLHLHRLAEHSTAAATAVAVTTSGFHGHVGLDVTRDDRIRPDCCADWMNCHLTAVANSGWVGGEWPLRGFVVQVADGVRAYVNRCAHLDLPLNYLPDEFLTYDRCLIQCTMHGAVFEKETGFCVAGPCMGRSLIALRVRIESDWVLLAEETEVEVLAARYARRYA